jgi:hypothetical protein
MLARAKRGTAKRFSSLGLAAAPRHGEGAGLRHRRLGRKEWNQQTTDDCQRYEAENASTHYVFTLAFLRPVHRGRIRIENTPKTKQI